MIYFEPKSFSKIEPRLLKISLIGNIELNKFEVFDDANKFVLLEESTLVVVAAVCVTNSTSLFCTQSKQLLLFIL